MKQSVVYIGIDVAKGHLDVAWQEQSRRFANDQSGRAALVAWIKQSPTAVQLLCEASGGYEQALLESLEQSDLKVTLVQRCGQSQPCHTRPSKSDRANTKHSAGI